MITLLSYNYFLLSTNAPAWCLIVAQCVSTSQVSGKKVGYPGPLPNPFISVSLMAVCLPFPSLVLEDAQFSPLGWNRIFMYPSVNTLNISYLHLGWGKKKRKLSGEMKENIFLRLMLKHLELVRPETLVFVLVWVLKQILRQDLIVSRLFVKWSQEAHIEWGNRAGTRKTL